MRKLILLLACISLQPGFAQEAGIKKTIEDFFTAFHARDTVGLKATFAKQMVLHSVAEKKEGGALSVESVPGFLRSMATLPADLKIEERLLSWEIRQDGNMAHVWTPYEFYLNGKLSHKGVNSFSLFKDAGAWKILYCVDTRRRP